MCIRDSNYAMLTVSEGAYPMEGEIVEGGPADAFGHRKLEELASTSETCSNRSPGKISFTSSFLT